MADFGDHVLNLILIMIIGLIMIDVPTHFLIVKAAIMTEVREVILLMLGFKKVAGQLNISDAWATELRVASEACRRCETKTLLAHK